MKKQKHKYRVVVHEYQDYGNGHTEDFKVLDTNTMAVSEAQAINNAKYRAARKRMYSSPAGYQEWAGDGHRELYIKSCTRMESYTQAQLAV